MLSDVFRQHLLTIFICNGQDLLDNIVQDFNLCCSESIKTTLSRIFSYVFLSVVSRTTLHKVFPAHFCLRRYYWDNVAQKKTLSSVVQEAPKSIAQEKILCNVLQYYWNNITQVKTLSNVVLEAPDNNVQEKITCNIVLIVVLQCCLNHLQCCL